MRRLVAVLVLVLAGSAAAQYPSRGISPATPASNSGTFSGDITQVGDVQICKASGALELGACSGCTSAYTLGTGAAVFCDDTEVQGQAFFTGGVIGAGAVPSADCTDDRLCLDNNGLVGGQRTGTTDPEDTFIRPQVCSPSDASCAAADVNIFGGQDTSTIAIDGADPTVTCAGDNDTVTVTVIDSNRASTATVLLEGTDWTAGTVAATCASLASAVDALAGVSATCTSPDVLISLDGTTGRVTLAESTAGCTTVATGTVGNIVTEAAEHSVMVGTQEWIETTQALGVLIRPATPTTNILTVGTAGQAYFLVRESTEPKILVSQQNFGATNTAITRTDVITFCGQGPNGATAVYMSPNRLDLFNTVNCNAEESTTEATADEVWAPFDFSAVSMECGCQDVAVDTGLTFSFRDDTATASTDLECTTGAGDGAGFVSCEDQDLTPPTVAAGSAIAMRVVAASGNFSTAGCWCRLTVSQ